jgi:hypothetical protein
VKEYVLTWGGLRFHELETEKSAEVIVIESNEPIRKMEDSQLNEGLNIK